MVFEFSKAIHLSSRSHIPSRSRQFVNPSSSTIDNLDRFLCPPPFSSSTPNPSHFMQVISVESAKPSQLRPCAGDICTLLPGRTSMQLCESVAEPSSVSIPTPSSAHNQANLLERQDVIAELR
ncbi:hypothetical protein ACRALDRAFT_209011 [Sodiomyces alcalophilus JCM 7366]|uniref:uncharacterized protein n=1 Tax=Sodiomyces alcalophilus JCM 7366 TaxID=591952 RepID=UPI0039B69F44